MTALTSFPTAVSVANLLCPAAGALTVDANGTGIDLQDYEGLGLVIANYSLGTDADELCTITLEDSADNSSFAAITAAVGATAFAAIVDDAAAADRCFGRVINVNQARRYLRAVVDVTGTTPAFTGTVTFVGIKKQR